MVSEFLYKIFIFWVLRGKFLSDDYQFGSFPGKEFFSRCGYQTCFPSGTVVKNPHANAGDTGDVALISGWGKSPGVGNGDSFQYSYLKNPMDREA